MKVKKNNEGDKTELNMVESFLGGLPLLENFFKELGKTETFQQRFKEVNQKIKENLEKGEKKQWRFDSQISVRPIINKVKTETSEKTSEITIENDYFYECKGDTLLLVVKTPLILEKNWSIKGKELFITADDFEKRIKLPGFYTKIKKKQYKDGILVLELTK